MTIRIQLRRDTAANWASANPVLLAGEMGIETDTLKIKIGNGTNWNSITNYANTTPSDLVSTLGDYVLLSDIGQADGVPGLNSSKNLIVPGSTIIVEGATDNAYETSIVVTDPTADRTITIPDSNGTVVLADESGNVTVSGNLTVSGTTTTVNSTEINIQNTLKFEGGTNNEYETTLTVVDPTADRTITFKDASGTVAFISDVNSAITTASDDATTKSNNALASANAYTDTELDGLHTTVTGEINTHNSDTTSVHGIADTSVLATNSSVASVVSSHNSDTTDIHGIADTAELATKTYADNAVSVHQSDTSNVHGIANTADLATTSYVDSEVLNVSSQLPNYAELIEATFSGYVTLHADPVNALHAATKRYVDNAVAGLDWKQSVNLLATTNIDISGVGSPWPIDGHSEPSVNTYRILLTGQTTDSENGIWLYNTDTNTFSRPSDADAYSELVGASVFVMEGTTYANTSWVQANHYLSSFENQNWTQFSGAGSVTGGTNITVDGTEISVSESPTFTGTVTLPSTTSIGSVSDTEIGYVNGVTSSIQDQLDDKAPIDSPVFTGNAGFPAQVRISSTGSYVFSDGSATSPSSGSVSLTRKSDGTGLKYSAGGTDYNISSENYVQSYAVPSTTPISEKTSDYTLTSVSERDTMIELNSSSAITLTIPPAASVDFPVGSTLDIMATNSGQVTIVGGSGVTVNATPGLKLRTQWSSATLLKRGSDSWVVYGDLKA